MDKPFPTDYFSIIIIFQTIWKDPELIRMTSYKFMFLLGVFDVIQCLPHFVTGIFTIFQTTWDPWLAKVSKGPCGTQSSLFEVMGICATPCYVGYTIMTVVLSFQRLVQLISLQLERTLFSGKIVLVNSIFSSIFRPFSSYGY